MSANSHVLCYDPLTSTGYILPPSTHIGNDGFLQSECKASVPYLCTTPVREQHFETKLTKFYGQRSEIEEITKAVLDATISPTAKSNSSAASLRVTENLKPGP